MFDKIPEPFDINCVSFDPELTNRAVKVSTKCAKLYRQAGYELLSGGGVMDTGYVLTEEDLDWVQPELSGAGGMDEWYGQTAADPGWEFPATCHWEHFGHVYPMDELVGPPSSIFP
jgi:hypothetical protein